MDLGRFVRLRRPLWDELEAGLARLRRRRHGLGYGELEQVALRYRQVLHDQATAAVRYPGTGTAARLRRLALEGTYRLSADEPAPRRGLLAFYAETFPRAFRAHRGPLAVAAALFVGAAVLGLLLAAVRPGLGAAMLGPERVAGLRDGRMWTESLVTTTPPAMSTSSIATNNLSVALTAWAGGSLAGLGALWVLLLNGFMLGAVLGVTLHYSMAGELGGFVAAHGPLELSLVVVSAAAGLGVARALVTAGDRPRSEVVPEAARRSLALLAGCLPWFVVLALVEVLVSPRPEVPAAVKAALGLGLLGLFALSALNPFTMARGDDGAAAAAGEAR